MCFRVVVALVFCTSHAFAGVWDFIRSRRTPRFKTGLRSSKQESLRRPKRF